MSLLRGIRISPWRLFGGGASPEQGLTITADQVRRQALRNALPSELRSPQARMLARLFKRTKADLPGLGTFDVGEEETRVSAGLASDAEHEDLLAQARADAQARALLGPNAAPRLRRKGPPTLPERSVQLERAVQSIVGRGHLEYRANTIAVIKDPTLLTRIIRFVLMLMTFIPSLIARFLAWALRPRGKGKLKRRVVTVDRRGNVIIFHA